MGEYTKNFLGKCFIQTYFYGILRWTVPRTFLGSVSYKHISMGFYGGRYQELSWEVFHTNIDIGLLGKCFIQNICIILLGTLVCVFLLGVPCSGASSYLNGGSYKEPNYIRNLVQALPDPDFAYTKVKGSDFVASLPKVLTVGSCRFL